MDVCGGLWRVPEFVRVNRLCTAEATTYDENFDLQIFDVAMNSLYILKIAYHLDVRCFFLIHYVHLRSFHNNERDFALKLGASAELSFEFLMFTGSLSLDLKFATKTQDKRLYGKHLNDMYVIIFCVAIKTWCLG